VTFNREDLDVIDALAKKRRTTRSALIREGVVDLLAKYERLARESQEKEAVANTATVAFGQPVV
jgi:hypothetical protein